MCCALQHGLHLGVPAVQVVLRQSVLLFNVLLVVVVGGEQLVLLGHNGMEPAGGSRRKVKGGGRVRLARPSRWRHRAAAALRGRGRRAALSRLRLAHRDIGGSLQAQRAFVTLLAIVGMPPSCCCTPTPLPNPTAAGVEKEADQPAASGTVSEERLPQVCDCTFRRSTG